MHNRTKKWTLAAACLLAAARAFAQPGFDGAIFGALQGEMNRSLHQLKFESFSPPYFLAYSLLDSYDSTLNVRYGATVEDQAGHNRYLYAELRYGSYDSDNTGENTRGVLDNASLEDDTAELRRRLWLMTDQAYKQAVKDYLEKEGKQLSEVDKDKAPDFSRETPHQDAIASSTRPADLGFYKPALLRASAAFAPYKEIIDSGITLRRIQKTLYYLNSEGTRIEMPAGGNPYFVYVWARTQADDGMGLDAYRTFSIRTPDRLPSEAKLKETAAELADELAKLRSAKVGDPTTAPAILDPESTGVLFHEALGHRVEGERQRDDDEGQTFKGQVGKRIIPSFLSVSDDPTLTSWDGVELNGSYAFDDEGVPAQKAVITENGVLRSYLMSRRPIKGFLHSNGHGRAQFGRDPIGRMSNLLVKSAKEVSAAKLKKMLLEECRRQNKPYGLLLRRTRSGDTFTSRGRYQAFRGTPEEVYLVDAKSGKETLIRGVELVGTPLITINKIIATGSDYKVDNAFCGAESGTVPVSTIAPSCLVKEIELQREHEDKQRPPILPAPAFDKDNP